MADSFDARQRAYRFHSDHDPEPQKPTGFFLKKKPPGREPRKGPSDDETGQKTPLASSL